MPVAEAVSLDPRLQVVDQDPRQDRQGLEKLAVWATRYSPIVGTAEQSLLLDISGCGPCFGGEERLLQRAARELGERWTARVAIADTLGAAWGLAHHAATPCLVAAGATELALRPLPIAALRLPPAAQDLLRRLGIQCIEQLLELPRADLPGRFGPEILQRLDQALGRLPEVFATHRPLPDIQAIHAFEYPTDRLFVLQQAVAELTVQIRETLRQRDWGARRIACWLYHEAAPPQHIDLGLCQPTRSPGYLRMLLGDRLARVRIAAPVRAISLRVVMAEPRRDHQEDLFEAERPSAELAALIDHLSNRLGGSAVTRATLLPDPQPEHACRLDSVLRTALEPSAKLPPAAGELPGNCRRPVRLCSPPLPLETAVTATTGALLRFQWAGLVQQVRCLWGPERIATGWWRGEDVQRDYYIVETATGNRFWVFRRRQDDRWLLHGWFD